MLHIAAFAAFQLLTPETVSEMFCLYFMFDGEPIVQIDSIYTEGGVNVV